jgi:hypothetical protein
VRGGITDALRGVDERFHLVGPRVFAPVNRPVPFAGNTPYFGPGHDDRCPCGCPLLAGDCHLDRSTGRWVLPPYTPLLTDAPTGFARRGCYASFTNDCFGKLTTEHWLSKGYSSKQASNGRRTVANDLWLEDIQVGDRFRTDVYDLTAEEIIEFATQWDPQPFHLGEEAAQDTLFKGLAASG